MKGRTMIDHYLGVDLHGRRSYLVLMNADGVIEDKRRMPNGDVSTYINKFPCNTHAVLEATGNWGVSPKQAIKLLGNLSQLR